MKYFILLRVFRVLKLLDGVKQYRIIFNTFRNLIPIFGTLMGIMITTFYFFSLLGVSLFGGMIYKENPDIYKDKTVPITYVYNNFNDFPNGLLTLFELLVVNN